MSAGERARERTVEFEMVGVLLDQFPHALEELVEDGRRLSFLARLVGRVIVRRSVGELVPKGQPFLLFVVASRVSHH
jgi:hypothetical protein